MGKYQEKARELWEKNQYIADLPTLILGLCEEVGEVAKAYNFHLNSKYIPTPGRKEPDEIEHELKDCLMYIAHIARELGIDLEF